MASLNGSQIQDYISKNYPGLSITPQFVQNVMNNSQGGDPNFIDNAVRQSPEYQQFQTNQAVSNYQNAAGSALTTLQTQKGNLSQQYSDLLKTVTGEYQPLINSTTQTAQKELGQRGITPDSTLYQQQVQGALQPVYGAEAANAQQIGQGSVADLNTYATNIANLQAGIGGTASQLPLQYGSLALSTQALPSQIALAQAQAKYQAGVNPTALSIAGLQYGEPFNVGNGQVFNPSTLKFLNNSGGGATDTPQAIRLALARMRAREQGKPSMAMMSHYITAS